MLPYYQDDLVTLYHGDCREVREWLDADVLVTDPPYGVRFRRGRRGEERHHAPVISGDASTALRDEALSMWGTRPALVFGSWRAPRPHDTCHRLIWDKGLVGGGNLTLPWGPGDEEVYVVGTWPPIVPGGRAREGGAPARGSNVLRVQGYPAAHRPAHPTPKPVELFTQLIERCPPGVIADPFAGSGPLALAAHQLGRPAILVELEERYCELIANRLSGSPGGRDAPLGRGAAADGRANEVEILDRNRPSPVEVDVTGVTHVADSNCHVAAGDHVVDRGGLVLHHAVSVPRCAKVCQSQDEAV